jgi:Putative amidoligase enzyme
MAEPASSTLSLIGFDLPPVTTNAEGRTRTVGVEIEFAGLTAEAAAKALAMSFGGGVNQRDPHAFMVKNSGLGDIAVELDLRSVHPDSRNKTLLDNMGAKLASWVGSAVRHVIPCELVTAPLPIDRLHEVDRALAVLREAGAKGTQDGALYAFGLHFNPEVPSPDAETIVSIIKAFVLLNPWLRRQVAPDTTRFLLGFADPFPQDYVRRLAAPDYWPDISSLIDDYLAANPTRNRDLDVLPLLVYLDEARVRARLPNEKINKRPTFHYRLPDARISDPGWSIAPDWNRWVAVERVATDRDKLEALGRAYLAFAGEAKSWAEVAERTVLA